jgi:hypothetical protein
MGFSDSLPPAYVLLLAFNSSRLGQAAALIELKHQAARALPLSANKRSLISCMMHAYSMLVQRHK